MQSRGAFVRVGHLWQLLRSHCSRGHHSARCDEDEVDVGGGGYSVLCVCVSYSYFISTITSLSDSFITFPVHSFVHYLS